MMAAQYKLTAVSTIVCIVLPAGLAGQNARADSARQDSLRRFNLPAVSVTATRVPAAPGAAGFASTVVDRRDLEQELEPGVGRVLRHTPGVSVEEGAGPLGPASVHLRGAAEPFTQMMVDGVPINISGGFNDIAGLLLTNVERVDISRGPLSALWGSSAAAGAIDVITRGGRPGPLRVDLLAEGGGLGGLGQGNGGMGIGAHGGQGRTELSAGGGSERLAWSAGGALAYNRGMFAIANDQWTRDLSLRVDAVPASRWTVSAVGRLMTVHSNLPVRDPGATRVPLDPNQRDSHERWLGSLSAGYQASPTWHHRLTASLLVDDFYYMDAHDSLPGSYPFFVSNFNLVFNSRLVRPGLEYVGTNELFADRPDDAHRLTLSYGARWQREAELTTLGGDFGDSRNDFVRANSALFTELQGGVGPRVQGVLGARLEKFAGLPAQLLPRAGLRVAVVPRRLALRVAAGRAFKAPNVDQEYLATPGTIPNPNLRPEHSASLEAGVEAASRGGAFTASAGWFRQRYTDIIETVPADSAHQTNENLGSTRASGVELEAAHEVSARLRWGANLAVVRSIVLDNRGLDSASFPIGATLPAVPAYTGTAWVNAAVTGRLALLGRVTVAGRQTVFSERFSGSRVTTAGYALVDLVVQWRMEPGWVLYTRGSNLFNTHYAAGYDKPGLPRAVLVGIRTTS